MFEYELSDRVVNTASANKKDALNINAFRCIPMHFDAS